MLDKKLYQGLSQNETREELAKLGFNPLIIEDPPFREYITHKHPEDKLLAILEGSMIVWVGNRRFKITKNDRLIIKGGKQHRAVVGKEGCKFFWSEKVTNVDTL